VSAAKGKATTVWDTATPTAMKAYGGALLALAREQTNVVCLGADLTGPTETDLFRDQLPDRFFNLGMAEANLMGVAAGMARAGDLPFVNTFGVFASRRPLDQIAMQIAYPRTNVKIAGFMPGLTTPGGVTHQAIEDVAIMRALPGMTIVEPADARQIAESVEAAAAWEGPVYLRLKRGETPVIEGLDLPLEIGRAQLLRGGSDAIVLASGLMVTLALEAADRLADEGIAVAVGNVHTLKPFDREFVIEHATATGAVVTVENHVLIGGLGAAVAECLATAGAAVPFERVGILDTFARGASAPTLFEEHGLTAAAIATKVRRALGVGERV
jgi:transketolase